MALEKNKTDTVKSDTVKSDTVKTEPLKKEPAKKEVPKKNKKSGYFVYIGPTIKGVVQSNTVLTAREDLSSAVLKYPLIDKLIISDETLAEDRILAKQRGNALNYFYKKLLEEVK